MTRPLSIAVVGLEHHHAQFWIKAIRADPRADVAGVWDAQRRLVEDYAARYGLRGAQERDSLIAACDAVAICSSTDQHEVLIAAACAAGKPILCEKPLASDAIQATRIAERVRAARIPFMQSFPKRFDPATHAIRDAVESGALGRVGLCRIRHGHGHGLTPSFRKSWFADPARAGGGALLDEGVHAADLLRHLFGDPQRVNATISSATLGLRAEDAASARFIFASGLIAEVTTSWCFVAADTSIELYGDRGTLLASGVDLASRPTRESGFIRVFQSQGVDIGWRDLDIVPHFKTGVFHEHVAWAFIDALTRGAPMPTGLRDGVRAAAMIDAAYKAAASGATEPIDYPPEPDT